MRHYRADSNAAGLPLCNRKVDGPASARISIDGREYVNFFGSGYLALTRIPELRRLALRAVREPLVYSRQVPSLAGAVDPPFEEVERRAAAALGTETSLYVASGYLIGAAAIASVAPQFDAAFVDEGAHYCLQDGARLSELRVYRYAHCDPDSLGKELRRRLRPRQRPLLVTDGVFATTGRLPPLAEYATRLALYDGRMVIDESHGFGVVGRHGRGAAEYCGVEHLVTRGATLSKAFCGQGAVIGCSRRDAAALRSTPVIRGACAGSPLSAAVSSLNLRYVEKHPELRAGLRDLAEYFRKSLRGIGVEVESTPAPIICFRCGCRRDMLELQARAFKRGILIYVSTYIGAGDGVIRCAVFRDHSKSDIDALMDAIGQL